MLRWNSRTKKLNFDRIMKRSSATKEKLFWRIQTIVRKIESVVLWKSTLMMSWFSKSVISYSRESI